MPGGVCANAAVAASDRKAWPLGLVYVDRLLVLFAWCCLRQDFRMFRLERMQHVENVGETFRPR
ncbi:MAG: WYL domain-containing protein, partial [Rubrivivax sp.]